MAKFLLRLNSYFFNYPYFPWFVLLAAFVFFYPVLSFSKALPEKASEKFARKRLSDKLTRLAQNPELQEGTFSEIVNLGASNNAQNKTDKNPFYGNQTYHSSVMAFCKKWAQNRVCEEYLPEYSSLHTGGSASSVEEFMGKQADKYKGKVGNGKNDQYAFFNVVAKSGKSYLASNEGDTPDKAGKVLAKENIAKIELNQETQRGLASIAEKAGNRMIAWTYDTEAEARDPKKMGNMEAIRLESAIIAKQMRNNSVQRVFQERAAKDGVEIPISEEISDCGAYEGSIANEPDDVNRDQRYQKVKEQLRLGEASNGSTREERMNRCRQMQRMGVYATNVGVYDGEVKPGDPNGASTTEALSQLQVLTIDRAGTDGSELPLPQGVQISKETFINDVTVFKKGGKVKEVQRMTNADQINAFNTLYRKTSAAYEAIAKRLGLSYSKPKGDPTLEVGKESIVKINGLSDEMLDELKGTPAENYQFNSTPEQSAAQLQAK